MTKSGGHIQKALFAVCILTVVALPVIFFNAKYRLLPPAGVEILRNAFKRKFLVQMQATLGGDTVGFRHC